MYSSGIRKGRGRGERNERKQQHVRVNECCVEVEERAMKAWLRKEEGKEPGEAWRGRRKKRKGAGT